MSKAMRTATCDCGFSVTSENESELVHVVQTHAKDEHGKSMTSDDVRAMLRPA